MRLLFTEDRVFSPDSGCWFHRVEVLVIHDADAQIVWF